MISYGNCVRSCLSVRRRESVESGRLMAADVWLVGPVGLILGSNGSFGDAWVSLLSLVGTELYICQTKQWPVTMSIARVSRARACAGSLRVPSG